MKRYLLAIVAMVLAVNVAAQDEIRIGIIGLDTSHSTAFTKLINSGDEEWAEGYRVVAAYPYGSQVIKSAYERIPEYTEKVKEYGVEIVGSIDELLGKVDCVLLETNDGNLHLEQAVAVFKAGKPCFIDKPLAATLPQAMAICELAERYNAKFFTSSTLRYTPRNQELRAEAEGKIKGADCFSPHNQEPTHPEYGFYGIHGIETLYTVMGGKGCVAVSRMATHKDHVVVGEWEDGRIGTFRAFLDGTQLYGGTVYTDRNKALAAGGYIGYKDLLKEILRFFSTGVEPISREESLEIFAFMRAANLSGERGGARVTIEEAFRSAEKEAKKLLKQYK